MIEWLGRSKLPVLAHLFHSCSIPAMSKIASRGATNNATSRRFALPEREVDGDWLDAQSLVDGAPPPLRTSVTVLTPRTILTRNTSPDVPFSQSINAYAGCEQPRNGCAKSAFGWETHIDERDRSLHLRAHEPFRSKLASQWRRYRRRGRGICSLLVCRLPDDGDDPAIRGRL
ncbi:hypothetical protein GGQ89_000672 [Sphingomonas yabuuchiae]|uniref:Uncharacterized protein n=1 Tax=Sphingomonas yabuuchiae TaxID=172044 RepID=A0ABR6K7C7_9SPHN|nr:hypothetical protein [Sphingomonas yabuuchiae]